MPRAKSFDFCPHCGCMKFDAFEDDSRRVFTCGEAINKESAGGLFNSYTCVSVPTRMRYLEGVLTGALARCKRVPLSSVIKRALITGNKHPHKTVTGVQKAAARILIKDGILQERSTLRGAETSYSLTPFGSYLATSLEEEHHELF